MQDKLKYSVSFRVLLVLLSKNTDSECKICSNYWESILDEMEYSIPVTDFALAHAKILTFHGNAPVELSFPKISTSPLIGYRFLKTLL
jgi:hypothetical protein